MNVPQTVRQQYQAVADRASAHAGAMRTPPEGWLRAVRKALGMSGAQLARRAGVTRARIAAAEQSELAGGITLRSMQAAAEAMGCRFVYAVVPPDSVEPLIAAQARRKAASLVGAASQHMALENQALPDAKIAGKIEGLARELAHDMPPGFWDD